MAGRQALAQTSSPQELAEQHWQAHLAGLPVPGPVQLAFSRLGACALGIGLLCVGATLSLQGSRRAGALIGWSTAIKLLALPLAALAIAWVLDMSTLERQMLLVFAALPTASSAHVLAARMGADSRLVALTMSIGNKAADRVPEFDYAHELIHHVSNPNPYRAPDDMDEAEFLDFLEKRLRENTGWDTIARELLDPPLQAADCWRAAMICSLRCPG